MTAPGSPAPPPVPALSDSQRFGNVLVGQYALEREVGRGGMGIVYLARDLKLERQVAIKTLPPHLATDATVRERFIREARTAARLSHPSIVPIHRADEIGGQVFFVMGFVDGESLAQRIRTEGRLTPSEVVRVMRDVAGALAYAHARGVIHRDVKAENILLEHHTGRALVTDFGIARLAEATPLTATGQVLGTVHYISPEQVSGEAVDARSDIYSLGVVGYLALSGRFPFNADLASAVLVAHVTKVPPPLLSVAPDVLPALASIIDRCLAKDPAERFQSGVELANALSAIETEVAATERAFGGASTNGPSPVIADTEAQAIWERAAELQALTGVQPRPLPLARERDAAADQSRTSGYRLSDVRDAAAEAGIAPQYVDHALAEHGLVGPTHAPNAAPVPAVVRDRSQPPSPISGGTKDIELEVVIDGEMPERDFDLLIDVIRRGVGEVGTLSAVGRSFTWHSMGQTRRVQVSVHPRDGKTTIRASENLGNQMGGLFGGLMGGIGGGVGGPLFAFGLGTHHPLLAIIAFPMMATIGYTTARTIFRYLSRKRATRLHEVIEDVANIARESIASRAKRLEG
jgi:eukaryotic-like serine/threonine-protein kinase